MILILVTSFLLLLCYFVKRKHDYWNRLGVPGPAPIFVVGNVWESLLFRKSLGEVLTKLYEEGKDAPFIGVYKGVTPCVIARDPEIIKDVMVKDFGSFHDNNIDVDLNVDPIFGRSPFFRQGEIWKIVRTQLTPCFTSGKMKSIYPLIEDMSKKFVEFINQNPNATDGCGVEAKGLCANLTVNNVASCAFGLDAKCFENPKSEFKAIAEGFLSAGSWATVKFILVAIVPFISRFLTLKFTSSIVEEQIKRIVDDTLKYRRENGITRNDFLQILNQLKETSKEYEFSDLDIAAHAAGFIVDGYETSSIVLSFLFYNLATNSDVQTKLRQEINETFKKNNGTLPYDELQAMTYLDAVFNESQRLHPAVATLDKRCTKDYTFSTKTSKGFTKPSVTIKKGTSIIIPIMGLHHDPKYYETPERFIPDRFLNNNKENLVKYTYLPFGEGPRACLGQRFGILQIKTSVAYVIKNFELSLNTKTKEPLKFDPFYFLQVPVGGIWINFKKITA